MLPLSPWLRLLLRWRAPESLRERAAAAAAAAAVGTGGAAPSVGGLPRAMPPPPAEGSFLPTTRGALRSFVTAFLSLMPLVMSELRAPCVWTRSVRSVRAACCKE